MSGRLVRIRLAYLAGVALTLLWAPLAAGMSRFHAWGPFGDLLFGSFARWDSGWFLRIAEHGYDTKQSAAFFPLYPLLVHAVAWVTRSALVAAVLVSLAAAGIAAEFLHRIARTCLPERAAGDSVLLLALYPIAFVFTAAYSDGLFLMLAAAAFLCALRDRPLAAAVAGALAVETRLLGLALLPALAVLLRRRGWKGVAPLALLPAAVGAYALYLHEHFHDAGAFFHAESAHWLRHTPALGPLGGAWDAVRSGEQGAAELVRHLPGRTGFPAGYPDAVHFAIWNVVQLLVLVAALWLTWVAWRRLGAAYGVYSAATLLVVLSSPAAVVPLVSLPRFLLADFPLFLALASIVERRPRLRDPLLWTFAAIGAAAAIAFSRGIWIA
ncbi:MAG: mannosyltransferase family protein [Gaiellaceae bacterium]